MPTYGPKPRPFESCWKLDPVTGCHEWQAGKSKKGYGTKKVAGRDRGAHRIAWERARGPIPDGLHVLHRCDNPGCVNPWHLFLGTNAVNVADKVSKGRQAAGVELARRVVAGRASQAKLNDVDIERIRDISRAGHSQASIARYFDVHQCHISRILSKKRRVTIVEAA